MLNKQSISGKEPEREVDLAVNQVDLDSMLVALEEHWQSKGASNIAELLPRIASINDPKNRTMAWTELCAMDLEWQWRRWTSTKPMPWGVSQYCSILPTIVPTSEDLDVLWDSEWIARSVWGDAPGCDRFHQLSGKIRSSEHWSKRLDDVCPLEVEVIVSNSHLLERPGPFFFVGRQREEEPSPPCWVAEKKRIAAWNLANVTVSRTLFSVRRTKLRQIEILNPSTKSSLLINQHSIAPGSTMCYSLPIHFYVEGTQLQFRCADGNRR